jgi:hypothetical protein
MLLSQLGLALAIAPVANGFLPRKQSRTKVFMNPKHATPASGWIRGLQQRLSNCQRHNQQKCSLIS